jgi:hypothetical protein
MSTGLVQNVLQRSPKPEPVTTASSYNTDDSAKTILYAIVAAPVTYAVARQGMEFSLATSLFIGAVAGFAIYNQWPQAAAANVGRFTNIWGQVPGKNTAPISPYQQ